MLQIFSIDDEPVWFELYEPDDQEIKQVEETLGLRIPTKAERLEIETSSRLYDVDSVSYMTTTLVASADSENPITYPTTFILHENILVTIRHAEFKAFTRVIEQMKLTQKRFATAQHIFLELLESITSRMADILEMIWLDIDELSDEIFKKKHNHKNNHKELHEILILLGKKGTLNSKCKESIENFSRLLGFYAGGSSSELKKKELSRIQIIQRDIDSLREHMSFIFNKVNFLLDATLGLINIEQNAIIKIFSVAAVIFLPPTLIASIYGMNFLFIPELNWAMGYPFALFLMILSAIFPYLFFKRKGWL